MTRKLIKSCAFTGHRPEKMPWGTDENSASGTLFKFRLRESLAKAVRLRTETSSTRIIMDALLCAFDRHVDARLLIRRLGIAAETRNDGCMQLDMFTDYEALDREDSLQRALLEIRKKYKTNSILKGKNFLEGATARERNEQIGGHRS